MAYYIITNYLDIPDIHCDAPAKSFIKQTLQFNGKHECDQIGVRVILDNERMVVLHNLLYILHYADIII